MHPLWEFTFIWSTEALFIFFFLFHPLDPFNFNNFRKSIYEKILAYIHCTPCSFYPIHINTVSMELSILYLKG